MRDSKKLLAVLAIGAVFAVAGCGGDDDTTSTGASGASGATGDSSSAAAPDKATFIKQADAICKTGDAATEQATQALGSDSSDAEVQKAITSTVVPAIQTELDGIKDLTPPEGDEDEINQILTDAQSALDQVQQDPSVLTGGQDPFKKANQEAKAYGLTVCGQ